MNCRDIDAAEVLLAILPHQSGIGASVWRINGWDGKTDEKDMAWRWPEKILRAKLSKLQRRGYVDGCCCGCRGDFTVSDKGLTWLASRPTPERT